MALGLYTVLPVGNRWHDEDKGLLAPMLPAVGLVLGICWWLAGLLCIWFLPRLIGAVVLALLMPALSGFLHLDGFMDVSDAILSRRPREEKLRILKDPHAGSFAVVAVCCLLLVSVSAGESVLGFNRPYGFLIVVPVIARALAGLSLMRLEPISQSQYGRMNHDGATKRSQQACAVALAAVLVVAVLFVGRRLVIVCVATGLAYVVACYGAVRSLGGMNGDIAGFSICISEAAGLMALALTW